jgi:hypothetical protein
VPENKELPRHVESAFNEAFSAGIAASRAVGYLVRLPRERRKLSYCE